MRSAIVDVPVVFGGTFDPIHRGHIDAANSVSVSLGTARVRMMLAGNPRLRDESPESNKHRWHMLQLACADEVNLIPDATELQDRCATRTVETIEKLGGDRDKPVIWVLGDDAAVNMPRWVRYDTLRQRASILILKRTNVCLAAVFDDFQMVDQASDLALEAGRVYISQKPVLDISATTIRNNISQKKSVNRWLHPDVLTYIIDKHLYRT